MTEILNGEELERELRGREPLTGSIKLRERDSESQAVYDDFEIEGVVHAGGSCIAYRAVRFFENSDMAETGILKEFYPVDSDKYKLSYNLKRYDIDAGDLAKQLYSEKSTLDNFVNAQSEFYECYKKISDVKMDNEKNNSFFAPIHIYRGIPSEKGSDNHTIYIWNPGDTILKSFDDHLGEMQKRINDEINSPKGDLSLSLAYELHNVLQIIKALAVGIKNLHMQNLLHLDIKPSNFGIRSLGENNGENISVSLFDINTIYSRSNPLARTGGSPYFRAPEMTDDSRNNAHDIEVGCQSDIYSLGATLYNSIIIGSGERGLYDTDKFSQIDTELSRSLIMECSEYNSKAVLHDILANILKRSLARRARDYRGGIENYISVGEFIEDITLADSKIKLEIEKAVEAGEKSKATLLITDKEDYYESKIDGGAVSAMQCLLYDYPLYNYVEGGELNVLVLGAGVFGQRFIDIAFELSQIKDCYLNITVVSDEREKDESRYLNSRPEIKNYFWVNGEKPKYEEYGAYGSINFVDVKSSYGDSFSVDGQHNREILEETLKADGRKFGYVFISLSDEMLNKKIACDLVNSQELLEDRAIVNFVTYKDLTREEKLRREKKKEKEIYRLFDASYDKCREKALERGRELNPVFVKNTLVNHKDFRFLSSRMAFNCHLLWEGGLKTDLNKAYGKFRSVYTYTSSFANALSISYKLHSLGLELSSVTNEKDRSKRERTLRELTLSYRDKIGMDKKKGQKTDEQKKTLNELTMYEHRRWVTNMILSSSYTELTDKEYEALGSTNKDKRKRKHTCIVPSRENWALNEEEWENLSCWSKPDIENTEKFRRLDPLDKMSVRLHRHFMKKARSFNMESVESDAVIIRRYLCDNPEALAAFNTYMMSLRTMTLMVGAVAKGEEIRRSAVELQQETLLRNSEKFKKFLTDSFPNVKDIRSRLDNISNAFEVVRVACDFSDYKAKDHTLVYNIPFILNYSTSTRLCIPFIKESGNNEWFENVASSIVINPSMVTYLVDVEDKEKILAAVKENLSNIARVMDGHSLQTKIALVIYVKIKDGVFEERKRAYVEKVIREISPRIYSIDIVEIRNQKDLASRIRKTFETNQRSSARFSAIEINDEFISGAVYAIPDLTIPTYEFNSVKKAFCTEDYEDSYIWFSDIPFNSHLNIEDMFTAHGRLSVYHEPELHRDYKDIFLNCYFDNDVRRRAQKTQGWKILCSAIKKKTEKDNFVEEIVINENNNNKTVVTRVFVPSFCRASIEKLFGFLSVSKHWLTDDVRISEYNSVMLEVSFKSTECTKNAFLKLFRNPYALIDDTKLKLIHAGRVVQIVLDSLVVNDFSYNTIRSEIKSKASEAPGKESDEYLCAVKAFAYLERKGYVIKFGSSADGDRISFCFASAQIKKLLTNEGQLLELYTYYETAQKGYYDEIKTGLEVKRKKEGSEFVPTQEFDLIAVKGFRSQFIEVKARKNLQQEFYQKLKSNGDRFGINKELILVSDLGRSKTYPDDMEIINRGKEDYNVETVVEVEKIADKLTAAMEKK